MVLMTTSLPNQAKPVKANTTDEFIHKSMVDEEGKGYLGKIKNPDYIPVEIEKPKESEEKKGSEEEKEPEPKKKTYRTKR